MTTYRTPASTEVTYAGLSGTLFTVAAREAVADEPAPESNPFAQLAPVNLSTVEALGRPDRPDHRTRAQKEADQALTDAEGFPRGF